MATTLAPLPGLNGDDAEGTLIAPINRITIAESASHGKISTSVYLQAVTVAGFGTGGLRERLKLPGDVPVFYAGLLSRQPRTASGLEQILGEFFGWSVSVEQFAGQWLYLDAENKAELPREGKPGPNHTQSRRGHWPPSVGRAKQRAGRGGSGMQPRSAACRRAAAIEKFVHYRP